MPQILISLLNIGTIHTMQQEKPSTPHYLNPVLNGMDQKPTLPLISMLVLFMYYTETMAILEDLAGICLNSKQVMSSHCFPMEKNFLSYLVSTAIPENINYLSVLQKHFYVITMEAQQVFLPRLMLAILDTTML